jgi:hypothetical protein
MDADSYGLAEGHPFSRGALPLFAAFRPAIYLVVQGGTG